MKAVGFYSTPEAAADCVCVCVCVCGTTHDAFDVVPDKFTSILPARGEEQLSAEALVLEREEFEPTVFQLCADNDEVIHVYSSFITLIHVN